MRRFLCKNAIATAILLLTQGCVFSSLQSARMLRKNTFEITPQFSAASSSFDYSNSQIGLQLAYGINDKFNLRARYEIMVDNEFSHVGYHFISLEPKFCIITDRMAFSIPYCMYLGENVDADEGMHIQPSFFLTFPGKYVELNANTRALVFFQSEVSVLMGFNLGMGLSGNLEKWAIRPEIGILFNTNGESGSWSHYSVGLSYVIK